MIVNPPNRGTVNQSRPGVGRVVTVHNSPGSPYAAGTPMTYDVAVDFGPGMGVRVYHHVPPANRYPAEYDVHGAGPGTPCLIAWDGDRPFFSIDWSEAVTTECTEGLL